LVPLSVIGLPGIHNSMTNETFITSGSGSIECPEFKRGPQARRALSPLVQMVEARANRPARIPLPLAPARPLSPQRRATLAALRAAELAAWEASGGDVLHPTTGTEPTQPNEQDYATR
jgi:hypothetical protein